MLEATEQNDRLPHLHLSGREWQYLTLACRFPKPTEGEIAEHMDISPKTVQKYCDGVYKALGVNCHIDMYNKAVLLGLVKCMCAQMKQAMERSDGAPPISST